MKAIAGTEPTHKLGSAATPALATAFFSSQAGVSDRSALLARFTQHNDCFLSSDSDYGTFDDYDAETAGWYDNIERAVGGETCNDPEGSERSWNHERP